MDPAARFTAQLVAGERATSVVGVVERCLAIQAQELKALRFGVRARSALATSSGISALLATGELVVSWLNRGTLHLVRAEDLPWLHALTTPQLRSASVRRLAQEGVSPDQADRGVALLVQHLDDGPATRAEIRSVLERAGIPVARQALVHILVKAAIEGRVLRGGIVGTEQQFVLREPSPLVDRDLALTALGPRYLAAHPGATPADLVKWAGITLGDARKALDGVARPVVPVEPLPGPLLLGPWDELLMGWVDRTWILDGRTNMITVNGIFKSVVLVGGRCVGTWGVPGGKVTLDLFEELEPDDVDALAADAAAVETFLTS